MKRITVAASKTYDVLIGQDLLRDAGGFAASVIKPCKVCVAADETVDSLYGRTLCDSLESAGFTVCKFTFAPGELSKTLKTYSQLLDCLAKHELTRSDAIIALGGGVTGDLAGFAAATYLRGISYIQVPTTFLAAIDSSVGGKTGVNLIQGKNLVGAFWQPDLVLCDLGVFASLPRENILDGVAEAIKYGLIADPELFDELKTKDVLSFSGLSDPSSLENIIFRCVTIKKDIVEEDERDTGKRQLLNFGHTIGHALEKCSGYSIPHGQAVAIGMLVIARAAYRRGMVRVNTASKIEALLRHYDFSLQTPYSALELSVTALMDKKRSSRTITLVIPYEVGDCRLEMIDVGILERFIGEGL